MSTTRTKTELVRMGWLTELRRQGHRQCNGFLFLGHKVCAFGLLQEVAFGLGSTFVGYEALTKAAGMNEGRIGPILRMNDSGQTFAEIADVVESWFST